MTYLLDKIYAKSGGKPETLLEHTENVLEKLAALKERSKGFDESFWRGCFFMCLFHDAGKISENFQQVLKGKYQENIRHEMLSGNFLLILSEDFWKKFALHTLSVFTHHKRLNDELFYDDAEKELRLSYDLIDSWYKYAKKRATDYGVSFPEVDSKKIKQVAVLSAKEHRQVFITRFYGEQKNIWTPEDRIKYICTKAVLNISDWSASGHFNLASPLSYGMEDLKEMIKEKLLSENKPIGKKGVQLRAFQSESKASKDILAIAPTGSGKTEAALAWVSQKQEFDKVIYCLPTRVTSNAIYKRLQKYFGEDSCAVVHSSALLLRKETDQDYDGREYLKDRTFFRNISVCTVDQLLTQGFNLGFWEVKTFHCRNAWIIIDEIHLYDPYTLALILNSIRYLKENFHSRFYIMSATMPKKLQALLKTALGNDHLLIQDKELLRNKRNIFEVRDKSIQENISEITSAIQQYQKILITLNTVDQAIEMYESLKSVVKDRACICYHSRFTQVDRIEKEKVILDTEGKKEPMVLIATQVVEVSLDIDFDILFTENAPIDALIQRAGRINRKGKKKNTKIIVHQHNSVSELVYSELEILNNTFEEVKIISGETPSEEDFLEMVDRVYQKIDVTHTLSFKEGAEAYKLIQENWKFLGDVDPYDENVITRQIDAVSVIPSCFYEKIQFLKKWEKSKYEISIRKQRYFAAKKPDDIDGFKYVGYTYSSEIGLTYPKKKEVQKTNQTISF